MGLQKYRGDESGAQQKNGGIPYYTKWMGGPTLALVRNCPIQNYNLITPRTVYVRGEALTFSSLPAACEARVNGERKTITGYITTDDAGEYVFRAHKDQGQV